MFKYLDISKWQGQLDFEELYVRYDTEFNGVFIRMGCGEKFDELAPLYVEECNKWNIPYGFYWYFNGDMLQDARIQANLMLKGAKAFGNRHALPLAMDYELDYSDGHELCKTFCQIIERADGFALLYTNQYRYNKYISPLGNTYMLWCAKYPNSNEYHLRDNIEWDKALPKETQLWQYTSKGLIEDAKPANKYFDFTLSRVNLLDLYFKCYKR